MRAPSRLETERLVLAPYGVDDFDDLFGVWSNPEVTRFIGGVPKTREQVWATVLKGVGHWQVFGYGFWTLRERATGAFVGEVGFGDHRRTLQPSLDGVPEMGWVLAPHAQGKGFASEAVGAALAWADAHLPPRTVCMIDPDNGPSLKLAARAQFREFARTTYNETPVILFEREPAASLVG